MEPAATLRFLSGEDVRQALPMAGAIDAMRDAFGALADGTAAMPVRSHIDVRAHDGTALFMPSYAPALGAIALKTVNVYHGNADAGLPRIQGLVCLFDGATGTPLAVLDGTTLTALRTGAASGLATDLMARADARTAAILGAGAQARTQLQAVREVRPIDCVRIFDPIPAAAERFAAELATDLKGAVHVARNAREAVMDADVVCAATVSRTPVFDDADIAPGTHINAIGSYQPDVQELPEATVLRARLVVDHRDSALAETGDLIIPLNRGTWSPDNIAAELGDLVRGRANGRTDPEQLTLFKSVGVAVQDLAAAARAVANAEQHGLGTVLPR